MPVGNQNGQGVSWAVLLATLVVEQGAMMSCLAAEVDDKGLGASSVSPAEQLRERGSLYLEVLRSVSFYSLHVELAPWEDLALGGGAGYIEFDGYAGFQADFGLTYWAWSRGSSSVVLALSLALAGVIDPIGDSYCGTDPSDEVACVPFFRWGLGLGVGVFYEFRRGLLLRIGVTPTFWPYSQSSFIWGGFHGPFDFIRLGALQLGWSF